MSQDNPSIEDLLANGQKTEMPAGKKEEQTTEKLAAKMGDIDRQNKERQIAAKAAALGLPYIDFDKNPIDREALAMLSEVEMKELSAAVFLAGGGELRLAAVEPTTAVAAKLKELAGAGNSHAVLYIMSEASLAKALAEHALMPKKAKAAKALSLTAADLERFKSEVSDLSGLGQKIREIPLTDTVGAVLAAGFFAEASDIHIEAEESGVKLRFRMDGILHEMAELPKDVWEHLISRLKLLAKLKMNITSKPQDGRISIELPDDKLEIRVSTLPTAHGESVAMRLLRSSSVGLKFEDLGLRGKAFSDLKREVARPNGMILTTGPTGSGKTTTLYAILNKLNTEAAKIITLEDPIEYKLEGINQSQVDAAADYTFAKGLRSVLRQDPDVVMVGEIRDLETADVAINAALTGHLVLSTLHTNDASGAIPRLLAMGVKPFLLVPAINAVIGQRLVRRICEKCKAAAELPADTMARAAQVVKSIPKNSGYAPEAAAGLQFYQGKKCAACNNSGFKGRVGIYEIFAITPVIEKLILAQSVGESDIKNAAQAEGMITMVQDGILKALDGITTVEEVFRVAE